MERIDYLEKARSRYTDQHEGDPIFDSLVQLLINQSQDNQELLLEIEEKIFDIDKSERRLLDLIGLIVGQDRIMENTGEFFGFEEDVSALGFGDINDPDAGGYWYSLYNGDRNTITVANDEIYRRLLKARIIFNNNPSTPETLLRVLHQLTGNTDSIFTEDNKGNIKIILSEDKNNLVRYFISIRNSEKRILPITLGVSVSLEITNQ